MLLLARGRIARNTVRRYLRGRPEAVPRPKRGSKLDPYKGQIHRWIHEDHLYNCEVMLSRLKTLGYTGSSATLRAYVHTLRPRAIGHRPVMRGCRPNQENRCNSIGLNCIMNVRARNINSMA